ncbi:MAG: hypothetical protein K1X64_07935 [Myxococcaceae bacterium]|nr:hypothetical protein [Myxococcaceae bacterium]
MKSRCAVVIAAVLLMASATLTIEGRTTCPSPREVASKLEGLLPLDLGISRTATLEQRAGEVQLTLRDAIGTVLATKVIRARPSCSELAEIAAVVLATWEAEFAERAPEVPEAPQSEAAHAPEKPVEAAAGRAVVPGIELGFGLTLSWRRFGLSGAVMPMSYMFEESRWGIEVYGYLALEGPRVGVGIGPRFRLVDSKVRLDAHLALLGTSLTMVGPPATFTRFDPGALVGLRVIFGRMWRPWLGVTGSVWPPWRNEPPPMFEVSFCWGISLGSG